MCQTNSLCYTCVIYKYSIFPARSFVCRFVLPALLWIATEIIEDLSNVQKVTDVHSLSMECHSIKLGTKVLDPWPNNLESFSHRNENVNYV